jgi:RHS repeat-associated protein
MYDSSVADESFTDRVAVETTEVDGGLRMTLTPDPKWLTDPARVWPVMLDPSPTLNATQDCRIDQGSPGTSLCSATRLHVGYGGGNAQRSLVQFDTSGIPYDAIVLNADLKLHAVSQTQSSAFDIEVHRVTRSWTNSATWNKYNGTNNWTTAGGDYANTVAAQTNGVSGATPADYHWYPTGLVQNWVNDTTNFPDHGMILKQVGESTANVIRFTSSEDVSDLPSLTVNWKHWMGELPFQKRETFDITDRIQAGVNLANGDLVVHQKDISIAGTAGFDFTVDRYYNSRESVQTGDSGWRLSVGPDVNLEVFDNGDVAYHEPTGAVELFKKNGSDYDSPPGVKGTLTKNVDGTYELEFDKNDEVYTFDSTAAHKMVSDEDSHGNTYTYTYTYTSGVLDQVTDNTHGREIDFTYNGSGLIEHITESNGPTTREWDYDYTSGLMTSYTDPLNEVTEYAYNGDNLNEITDPGNNVGANITEFTYSSDGVRDVTFDDPGTVGTGSDPTTSFTYTKPGTCTGMGSSGTVGKTVVTDANGNDTTHCWDKQGRVVQVEDDAGHKRSQTYDSSSNVESYTDALTQQTNITYNPGSSDVASISLPTGATSEWGYDTPNDHRPDSFTASQGNVYDYVYNGTGDLTVLELPGSGEFDYDYNADGNLTLITDANDNDTTFAYYDSGDGLKNTDLESIDYPAPLGDYTFDYDGLSRLTSVTDGKGQITEYTYDKLDRITLIEFQGGATIACDYWPDDSLDSRVDVTGTTTFDYTFMHQLETKTLPGPETIDFEYDPMGNLIQIDGAGPTITYDYNNLNLLETLTEPGSNQTTFDYWDTDKLKHTNYPNGVVVYRHYDDSQRLDQVKATKGVNTLTDFTYTYNDGAADTGLIQTVTDANSNTTTYGYNILNMVNDVMRPGPDYAYTYDSNGNMLTKVVGGTTTYYTYNAANQLCRSGSSAGACPSPATFTYDANGNMTADGSGTAFAYNSKDQTSSITPSGGSAVNMSYTDRLQTERVEAGSDDFTYDVLGLRSRKIGSDTTYYVRTNTGQLVGERIPNGGGGTDRHYYLFGTNDSVAGLSDSSGNLEGTYTYSPYGERLSAGSEPTTEKPWRFDSQYRDSQTGLYKMGARYFDPGIGWWTQQDPQTGSRRDPISLNRYQFSNCDPINQADVLGLATFGDYWRACWMLGSYIAGVVLVSPNSGYREVAAGFGAGCGFAVFGTWAVQAFYE